MSGRQGLSCREYHRMSALDPLRPYATGGYRVLRFNGYYYFLLRLLISGFDSVYQNSTATMAKRTEHRPAM
jgi:hypothetical protein